MSLPSYLTIMTMALLSTCLLLAQENLTPNWPLMQGDWGALEEWVQADEHARNPPPFEKIYVDPEDMLFTYQGCFHVNKWGKKEKVCAVRNDCYGCYVIKITKQCPVCGRYCKGNEVLEGYDCPFGKIEVLPHIWSEP